MCVTITLKAVSRLDLTELGGANEAVDVLGRLPKYRHVRRI